MVHLPAPTLADAPDAGRPVFLREAYVATGAPDEDPVAAMLSAIRSEAGVGVLGTVVIPADESLLCLIEAPSREAVDAIVGRIGRDAIRVVEVRWRPG